MSHVIIEPSVTKDIQKLFDDDPKLAKKVFDLIDSILVNPFQGIGKPEPLKYQ